MTDLQSPPSDSPEMPIGSTWEDDETRATLFLRALFTLLAGSFLTWAQTRAPFTPGAEWNRWIALSLVANLLLPLGIIWMFFGQGLTRLPWLRDQKYNAWNYGWDFRAWRRHLLIAGVLGGVMLPALWYFSRSPTMREYYSAYLPPVGDAPSWLWLIVSLTIYMFCWEWFHRGFLLFGMAQGFGPAVAILLGAAVFGLAHAGKPGPELWSSFAGGAILGFVSWREKSFAPAFYTHALVHITWAILILSG